MVKLKKMRMTMKMMSNRMKKVSQWVNMMKVMALTLMEKIVNLMK